MAAWTVEVRPPIEYVMCTEHQLGEHVDDDGVGDDGGGDVDGHGDGDACVDGHWTMWCSSAFFSFSKSLESLETMRLAVS